jgi:hypothetical protein
LTTVDIAPVIVAIPKHIDMVFSISRLYTV